MNFTELSTEQTTEEIQRLKRNQQQKEKSERSEVQTRKAQYYTTLPLEIAQAKLNEFIEIHAPVEYHMTKQAIAKARDDFSNGFNTMAKLHQIARELNKCDNLTTRELTLLKRELVNEKKRQQYQLLVI